MVDREPDETMLLRPMAPPDWWEVAARVVGDRRRVGGLVAAGVLVLGAVVAGWVLLRTPPAPPIESQLPMAGAGAVPGGGGVGLGAAGAGGTTTSTTSGALVVHAAGAVAGPGVHRVPVGSRVADLLAAAGGPAADADLDRVNQAATLTDGERVWFPRVGEEAPPPVAGGSGSGGGDGGGGSSSGGGPVDVNAASADELDGLPGVGPAIAAAIIEHRQRHGPFRSVDALLDVPGIGDAKLAQLRDLVTV